MTLNFVDLTGVLADVDNLPSKLFPTLLRRVRTFDTKKLIAVHREEGGRREGRVDLVGACMARVHSELVDFGMDATILRDLRQFFDGKLNAKGLSRFEEMVSHVRDGKNASLIIRISQRPDPWFKGHSFHIEGVHERNERAANALSLLDESEGLVVRASLELDLHQLLSRFIREFELAVSKQANEA